jgi:HD domain
MNGPTRAIVVSTVAAGVVALAAALVHAFTADFGGWWAFALPAFALAGLVGELATVAGDEDSGEPAFSFATSAHLAAIVLLPWSWAVVAATTGAALGEIVRRQPPIRAAFNAAVAGVSTLGGALLFGAINHSHDPVAGADIPHVHSSVLTYSGVFAALVVYAALSIIPVAAIIRASTGQGDRTGLVSAPLVLTYIMEACLGVMIVTLLVEAAPALIFLPPLVGAVFLSLRRYRALRRETREAMRALAAAVDARDPYTAAHSERVGDLAARLAKAVGMSTTRINDVRWAGRLHDIGKISVDNSILHKDGPLDDQEWEAMRRHPAVSAELIAPLSLMRPLHPAVLHHHERWDGRGYQSIPGEDVPQEAFFIALADGYDAMTSDRPYRKGMPHEEALRRIEEGAGTQYPAALARLFVAMLRGEPVPVDRSIRRLGRLDKLLRPRRELNGCGTADPSGAPTAGGQARADAAA